MNFLGLELVRDLVALIQQAEADDVLCVLLFASADPDYFISPVDVTRITEYRPRRGSKAMMQAVEAYNWIRILRQFLLRGGTATFDDFHGPIEWTNFERHMKRVFPDREIVDLDPQHPVFTYFYRFDAYPQVAGLGSFLRGRTWEKQGFVPHLSAILDDQGRAMVLINWNTDMGDGWEWSNAESFPGYVRFTSDAYRMMSTKSSMPSLTRSHRDSCASQ